MTPREYFETVTDYRFDLAWRAGMGPEESILIAFPQSEFAPPGAAAVSDSLLSISWVFPESEFAPPGTMFNLPMLIVGWIGTYPNNVMPLRVPGFFLN